MIPTGPGLSCRMRASRPAPGVLQREGRPLRVKYAFLSEKRYQDQGLMIQQFLRQVGIEITLEAMERGDFFGRVFTVANRDNLEMVGLAWFNLVYPTQVSWKRTSAAPARPRGSSSTPTRRSTNCSPRPTPRRTPRRSRRSTSACRTSSCGTSRES